MSGRAGRHTECACDTGTAHGVCLRREKALYFAPLMQMWSHFRVMSRAIESPPPPQIGRQ